MSHIQWLDKQNKDKCDIAEKLRNSHLPLDEGVTSCTSDINFHKGGEFKPNFMYGEYLTYCAEEHEAIPPKEAMEWIEVDISTFIPEEYRELVEIIDKREIPNTSDHLNRHSTIGWKYMPKVLETPRGNEIADFIDSKMAPCIKGMMSYKKNGFRYQISKTKVDK